MTLGDPGSPPQPAKQAQGRHAVWRTLPVNGNRKHLRSFMKGVTISLHRMEEMEKKNYLCGLDGLPWWFSW